MKTTGSAENEDKDFSCDTYGSSYTSQLGSVADLKVQRLGDIAEHNTNGRVVSFIVGSWMQELPVTAISLFKRCPHLGKRGVLGEGFDERLWGHQTHAWNVQTTVLLRWRRSRDVERLSSVIEADHTCMR